MLAFASATAQVRARHAITSLSQRRSEERLATSVSFVQTNVNTSTPTPTGSFFVQETVVMPASEAGGPFALATSARSDVLHNFNGGPGQTPDIAQPRVDSSGSAVRAGTFRLLRDD